MKEDTYSKHIEYKSICEKASVDDETFNTFKGIPQYRTMLEHANNRQGQHHFSDLKNQTPELLSHFDKFKTNDTIGNPTKFEYDGVGLVSSTTIQYVRVLSDLITYFGSLDRLKIVEIGSGYGGQCKIICDYFEPRSYVNFEMTEPSKLVFRYIDHFKINNAISVDAYIFLEHPHKIECDLVISNFAFSEQSKHIQDIYLEYIIQPAKRGYLWMNESDQTYKIAGIKKLLTHKFKEKRDIPTERGTNRILYWNESPDTGKILW